ncbi:DUF349 domain-containing protein [Thiorhodovibrio frisius]|uniref:DUF349 domain-containing protein n=1 Tax=Thiorhodovibrio frisius TaxID=631362 RepID=H8Z3X1_9GAMM|nr:DUF349 domain-containing protein [Thiorhodovibrio frisius]EIC21123.1 protein of unknown function (DUF349) [Thiorhodovibrio frisius]WPL22183.1 hypothetical protein Thiofri_02342 [Thiorhodovibrio frisius]
MIFKRLFRKAPAPAQPDPHLLAEAALNSADPAAQRQACRMIDDLRVLRQAAEESPDIGTQDLAAARYRHLICRLESGAPQLDQALAEIASIHDPEHLGEIAREAQAAELRLAAMNQLPADAPALARCAIEDALPSHRQHAVERLSERHLLEQVIKQIGKKDTKVYRLAREKMRTLAQQEDRPRLARQRCTELCAQVERLGRHNNWIQDRARLKLLDQQWAEIEVDVESKDRDHYQDLRAAFIAAFDQHARANAQLDADRQNRADSIAQKRRLIARLRALATATDAEHLTSELAAIGDAWSAIDGEHSLTEPGATAPIDAIPAQEDDELDALRSAGQQALEQALARQRQLNVQRQAGTGPREQNANEAGEPRNTLADQTRQRERQEQLLAEVHALLETPGPMDAPSARKRQQQLAALLATQSRNEDVQTDAQPDTQPERAQVALEHLGRRLAKQQRLAERKLAEAPEQLQRLGEHLEAGELRKAESLYQKINTALDHARAAGLSRSDINRVDKQLKAHQARLRELQRWRRWSADQGRESLCHEAESLALRADAEQADAELDSLAAGLNHLRRDWRRICQSGTPASDNYWQRFKQATDRVAARCEPFFQARAERQRASREARRTLCEKLEHFLAAVDWDSVDWKAMVRAEREMRQAWSALGPMEDGARGGLEGRFRRGLARVDKALKEERARNQAHKRDLIARMQALTELDDLDAAINQAKPLQKQWHTTVSGRQQEENALWQKFRTASDAIFARRQQERASHDQEVQNNLSHCEALCEQAEAVLLASGAQASQLAADWDSLAQSWRDSLSLPLHHQAKKRLQQRWNRAEQALHDRLQALRDQADWQELDQLRQQSDFLSQSAQQMLAGSLPSPTELTARWSALGGTEQPGNKASKLTKAFAALLDARNQADANTQLAKLCETNHREREEICLRLEILTHLDSPPEWVARRMELQVERLQEKLRDGDANPLTQSKPLLKRWYLAAPAAADADLQARFARIESALRPKPQADKSEPSAKPRGDQKD